jgi:hypothetical protein
LRSGIIGAEYSTPKERGLAMDPVLTLKFFLAILAIAGLLLGFFERVFRSNALLLENLRNYPNWLSWLAWLMTTAGALGYIFVDLYTRE